jgi:transposase InsO family protein
MGNGCIFKHTNKSGKVVWKIEITVGKDFKGNRKRVRRTAKSRGVNQFCSLDHAKGIIGLWEEEYNTIRPHSSLGYVTPSVYAGQCTH